MTEKSVSNGSSSNVASVSFLSSNFDNLELARAKAAESIVNVNQYFLEINGELKVYSDRFSLLGDNSEDLTEEIIDFNSDNNENPDREKLSKAKVVTFATELKDGETKEENDFTILPRSWTLQSQFTLPNIRQIMDTRASDHYTAGMISLKSAQWTKAISHFTKCIHLKPNEPSYYANRAEVFIQLTDFQSAILNYKRACILDPGNRDFFTRLSFLYVFQSQILFDQELYSSALEAIGRAIEMTPTNKAFHIRAISCLAALNRHSECLALVNKQLDLENNNADFFVLRAKLHSNFRNFSLCYFDLVDALRIDPDHIEAKTVLGEMAKQADMLKDYAIERALNNRLQEAISKLSLAIDLNPVVGDYHVKRGAFYRRLKDFTAAIDDFIMSMDKVDHNEQHETYRQAQRQLIMTFNDFAVSCFQKNCFNEAIVLLNKAIQAEKNEPIFYMNRGDCFFKLEQWDFALADYRQSGTMAAGFLESSLKRCGLVFFSKGQRSFNEEKYHEAEQSFSEAIETNPFPVMFWCVRARTKYLMDDFRGSRKDLICSCFLGDLDLSLESIFARLFPGKSTVTVLETKLARKVKSELDVLIKSHPLYEITQRSGDIVAREHIGRKASKGLTLCLSERQIMKEEVEQYRDLEREIKRFSDDKSLIKRSNIGVRDFPDLDSLVEDDGTICGIVGRSDGSTYVLDNKGTLMKSKKPQGWRKFKNGITLS